MLSSSKPAIHCQWLLPAGTGVSAKFIHSDVSIESDVKAMVDFVKDNFGRLDYAFDNAGEWPPKSLHPKLGQDCQEVSSGQIHGPFRLGIGHNSLKVPHCQLCLGICSLRPSRYSTCHNDYHLCYHIDWFWTAFHSNHEPTKRLD